MFVQHSAVQLTYNIRSYSILGIFLSISNVSNLKLIRKKSSKSNEKQKIFIKEHSFLVVLAVDYSRDSCIGSSLLVSICSSSCS